jgi:hypothetical protein
VSGARPFSAKAIAAVHAANRRQTPWRERNMRRSVACAAIRCPLRAGVPGNWRSELL